MSEQTDQSPRVAALVLNDATYDSRVKRTAAAAAVGGFGVLIIGRSEGGPETRQMGRVVIQLVQPAPTVAQRVWEILRNKVQEYSKRREGSAHRHTLCHVCQEWLQQRIPLEKSVQQPRPIDWSMVGKVWGMTLENIVGSLRRIDGVVGNFRSRAWQRGIERLRHTARQVPFLTSCVHQIFNGRLHEEKAFARAARSYLREFKPDLIHAHDATTLLAARDHMAWARRHGKHVRLVYDAHEYLPGLDYLNKRHRAKLMTVERKVIALADRVVTVSPTLAERLELDYRLRRSPMVVANAPIRTPVRSDLDIRGDLKLPAATPLIVYSGIIGHLRGLEILVDALPLLEGVHLAFVLPNPESEDSKSFHKRAGGLGVKDRVHLLPFVRPWEVTAYLRSADIGAIPCLSTINHEITLPNKLFEFIHAGIPCVASDMKTIGGFVKEHGIGEVFRSNDVYDFVRACRCVLGGLNRYHEAMRSLRAAYAWEKEGLRLINCYRKLLGMEQTSDLELSAESLIDHERNP